MISSVGRKVFGFGNSNSASTSPKNTSATLSSHSNRFATSTTVRKESPSATHSEHSKQSSSTLTGQTPPVASSSIASREETDTRKVDVENLEKDSVKLPAVNQPATVTDNSYMPHTLSSTSENQSSSSGIPAGFTGYFPDGLTHEEKSVAIKRLSKMGMLEMSFHRLSFFLALTCVMYRPLSNKWWSGHRGVVFESLLCGWNNP